MKRNARYTGGSGTGVDLVIPLVDGQDKPRHFDPGDVVPTEIAGVAVDPAFVDALLEQEGTWTPASVRETADERTARELAEHELAEQQAAGDAAAAEYIAAAELAEQAAATAAGEALEHRAQAAAAAAAAIARVQATQRLAKAQADLADLNAGGDPVEQTADDGEKGGTS